MPKLECKRIFFYSENDELLFFEWIERINCISKWEGVGDRIILYVKSKRISDKDLRDLLALFQRYKINMRQLEQFHNAKNSKWFYENDVAYWIKKVFK
jgi:hypothetical protein